MNRVCFSGDWHGDFAYATQVIQRAAEAKADQVIQLGDFGIWPGSTGEKYLYDLDKVTSDLRLPLYFIDGNHEDHDQIDRWLEGYTKTLPFQIADFIWYLPRGSRVTLDGVRFGALGGAFSVDWRLRTQFVSWWPQEMPVPDDVIRLGTAPVDILLTHDAPVTLPDSYNLSEDDERKCETTRFLIREAVERTQPQMLIHGHWHRAYRSQYKGAYVIGLASNFEPVSQSTILLDTSTKSVLRLSPWDEEID